MFGTKKQSSRTARQAGAAVPILVMPRQTADDIESRQRIRESLHDARATVVHAPRRRKKR